MLRKAAVFMLGCALVSTSALANFENKPRIASTSLCGDSYLLALAPAQVSALSWQSRHQLSRASAGMKALPQMWDDIEKLAASDADVILLGPGEGGKAGPYLANTDIEVHSLVWGEDFDTVKLNVKTIGDLAGVTSQAKKLNEDISERLQILQSRGAVRGEKPTILYLSRSGGTAGKGTYIDAAINAAGGGNIISTPGWQTLDPEMLIRLSPDVIMTSFFEGGYESVQAKSIRHAVLVEYIKARPVIDIPGSLWPCAGPDLIEAAEIIADGLDGLE